MVSEQERHKEIIEYVRAKGKVTKAEVIRHLKDLGMASTMTAHYDIINIITEGKITVLKDKPNSQTHHLIINDKSEFIQIDQELSKMERIINILPNSVEKQVKPRKGHIWIPQVETAMLNLQFLLVRTSLIHTEKDSQILYKKIIRLMLAISLKNIKARRHQSANLD